MSQTTKSPWLALAPPLAILALALSTIAPWVRHLGEAGWSTQLVAAFSAIVWLLLLWWAWPHLSFQLASLLRAAAPPAEQAGKLSPHFLLLYLACDDFQSDACRSWCEQEFPPERFRELLGDDSRNPARLAEIDAFCAAHPRLELFRRPNRAGFKAGNINRTLAAARPGNDEWVVLVDADQVLPRDYLRKMSQAIGGLESNVAFVQGVNEADHRLED
ncbi:MAG: glycosyltransferase, partial [Pirellulaceae bacterium]